MSKTTHAFQIAFTGEESFEAYNKAEQWLRERGFSYGSMQAHAPTGILHGDFAISKWRNMSKAEQSQLDGTITAASFLDGPVTVTIFDAAMVPA